MCTRSSGSAAVSARYLIHLHSPGARNSSILDEAVQRRHESDGVSQAAEKVLTSGFLEDRRRLTMDAG